MQTVQYFRGVKVESEPNVRASVHASQVLANIRSRLVDSSSSDDNAVIQDHSRCNDPVAGRICVPRERYRAAELVIALRACQRALDAGVRAVVYREGHG